MDQWLEDLMDQARILGEARMLRDETEITTEIRTEIISRLRGVLAELGKSAAWAARSMSVGQTTLSEIIAGTYKGDVDHNLRIIDKWTDQQIGKMKAAKPSEFVKISTAQAIIGATKLAVEHDRIVVVYGPSGVGKTITARFLASEYPGSIYIMITESRKRPRSILDMIASELRIDTKRLTLHQLEREVIEKLSGTGRLILVDEVHSLVTGKSKEEQSLTQLRTLQEETNCPMVWFGTADLEHYISFGSGIRQGCDQIYGRVIFWLDLAAAVANESTGPGAHTVDDLRKILAQRQLRITPEAIQWLKDKVNKPGQGSLRIIDHLVRLLSRDRNREITAELLEDLHVQRLGKAAATRLELKERAKRRTA